MKIWQRNPNHTQKTVIPSTRLDSSGSTFASAMSTFKVLSKNRLPCCIQWYEPWFWKNSGLAPWGMFHFLDRPRYHIDSTTQYITSIPCLHKSMKPNPDDDQVSSHFGWLTSNHLQLCSLCKLFMAKSPLLLVVFALCRIPVPKSYSERLGAGS